MKVPFELPFNLGNTLSFIDQPDFSARKQEFNEICEENGFAFKRYEVITDDGYILNVFNIPGLINDDSDPSEKPPVLL